jgi:hypothetical protein
MSEGCSKIEDMCLFWDAPTADCDSIINISLRPLHSSGLKNVPAASIPSSLPKESKPATINDTPESVLQFERALRKAEHAKKAGKDLSTNDLKVVYKDDHIVVVVRKNRAALLSISRAISHSFLGPLLKEQTTWCAHCTGIAFTGKYSNVNS